MGVVAPPAQRLASVRVVGLVDVSLVAWGVIFVCVFLFVGVSVSAKQEGGMRTMEECVSVCVCVGVGVGECDANDEHLGG